MSEAAQKRRVFISHSGEDTWVARQIAKEIADRDGEPFLDEADVSIGAEFEEDIPQFLDTADEQ
ncbi:MAG: toll/interleukin-1 receptor domain-containing protein [Anaerolineae bacterium]|nr:toll/interleukin-1 receptor domain-containing protein [Anaerolineae bacterium]NUQ04313.1 toll/interleukin-1 receptor domain-containing protein [Anaerolineae bacterium]